METKTSSDTLLFNESYCEIKMLPNGILHAKWSGFLTIDTIQKGCRFMTKYIGENGIKSHLSNHVDLKVLTEDCKNYLTQEWFAEVENLGLRKVAALISPNLFTRSSIDQVNQAVKLGNLTIETFGDNKEAEKWLLS